MNESENLKDRLEVTAKILLRCFILNLALVLFWFLLFLGGSGRWGYEIHSRFFDITSHEFALINYCGMAFVKLCNIVFFFFPYVAIRMALKHDLRSERK